MIDVLLAQHRPNERWLQEQRESVLAQRGVRVNLIEREDVEGLGACQNFSALLSRSHAEYVAFSDQDDVWLPDKLQKCKRRLCEMEELHGKTTPLLVFCDGFAVDENLKPLGGTVLSRQKVNVEKGLAFNRLLMQNFIPGNAMLFNAALRERAGSIPTGALMHDAWIALVAAAFGHIGFVDEPLYKYRQHRGNVLGQTSANASHFATRIKEGESAFRARLRGNAREAQAFVDRYKEDSPASARALAGFPDANWLTRRCLLFKRGLWKQGFARNLGLFFCG